MHTDVRILSWFINARECYSRVSNTRVSIDFPLNSSPIHWSWTLPHIFLCFLPPLFDLSIPYFSLFHTLSISALYFSFSLLSTQCRVVREFIKFNSLYLTLLYTTTIIFWDFFLLSKHFYYPNKGSRGKVFQAGRILSKLKRIENSNKVKFVNY